MGVYFSKCFISTKFSFTRDGYKVQIVVVYKVLNSLSKKVSSRFGSRKSGLTPVWFKNGLPLSVANMSFPALLILKNNPKVKISN